MHHDRDGLHLWVARSGAKTWRKDYRWQGARRTFTIGAYPAMRLADARKQALELNTWIKTGIDPRTQAPGQQRKQVLNSRRPFTQIAQAWFEHHSASWSNGSFRVWPQQLLFHNSGWYLVFEEDAIGTGVGLIRSERIDRLALRRSEQGNRRSDEAHSQALRRLELLLHHSGGIYFGSDLKTQLRLASPNARIRAKQLVTLRFCCQGWCFAFIREGLQRSRSSTPASPSPWPASTGGITPTPRTCWSPAAPMTPTLIRMELDLPPWTMKRDIGLRNWLFSFGAGIRIDSSEALRDEHRQKLETALAVYQPG